MTLGSHQQNELTFLRFQEYSWSKFKGRTMKQVLHIYCRVSSEIQSSEGTSLESQQQLGKLKAKALKFEPKIWLEGVASSNHEDINKREVLSSLMTAIEDGVVKHLYVTEQSRLARTDHVASMIRYKCNVNGVTLYIKDTVYDFSNPMDVLTVQIMGAFSQFENAVRKERSRLGKLQKVREGFWHGGEPPYGFKLKTYPQGNKLVKEPNEAKWVKEIFNWYSKQQSTKYIQQMLRQNYVQARRGGSFSLGSIQRLLKNTHHIGKYVFTDSVSEESIEVSCPRIVDDAIWHDCQKKRESILLRKGQTNRTVHFSLLKEMMWCGHCGSPFGAKIQPTQNKEHYYCPKKERVWKESEVSFSGSGEKLTQANKPKTDERWKRGRHCEMTKALNINVTNDMVWEVVTDIATKSNVLKEQVKTQMLSSKKQSDKDFKEEIRNLQKTKQRYSQELSDLETATAKIQTDRVMKRISAKQTDDILNNINSEIKTITKQLEDVTSKLRESDSKQRWVDWVGQFHKSYSKVDKFNEEERKQYLTGLVDRIDVRLDSKSNEHLLDINFQYPIVDDKYVVKPDPNKQHKGRQYKIVDGKHNKELRGVFNFKQSGLKKKQVKS